MPSGRLYPVKKLYFLDRYRTAIELQYKQKPIRIKWIATQIETGPIRGYSWHAPLDFKRLLFHTVAQTLKEFIRFCNILCRILADDENKIPMDSQMKRRDLLKLGLFTILTMAGGAGVLKIFKHASGAGKILQYPDPKLRRVAAPVGEIDNSIVSLSRQMVATLQYHSLVGFFSKAFMSRGLAAPQLGVSKRLVACDIYGEIRVLVNPKIVESRGDFSGYENCLSLPDYERLIINRPAFIKVKYRDLDSREDVLSATRGYAAVLAHEIDHLDGVLYIDHQEKPDNAASKDTIPAREI